MKTEGKIRILVADDHALIRMGLVSLVNTEPDITVVAEAADGKQAVEMFDKCQSGPGVDGFADAHQRWR